MRIISPLQNPIPSSVHPKLDLGSIAFEVNSLYVRLMFYIYIITNRKNGTLYLGQTDDLSKRMWEHKNKTYKGFASKYDLTKLVWYDILDTREYAFANERRMKAWKRAWKINTIEEQNPEWEDLTFDL